LNHPSASSGTQSQAEASELPQRDGDSWILRITEKSPSPMVIMGWPWRECSTITIEIHPHCDTPDPIRAPFVDLGHAYTRMSRISNRVIQLCSILKRQIQPEIAAGTMAIKVIFGEC
jgi:hypothetical protein